MIPGGGGRPDLPAPLPRPPAGLEPPLGVPKLPEAAPQHGAPFRRPALSARPRRRLAVSDLLVTAGSSPFLPPSPARLLPPSPTDFQVFTSAAV